MHWLDIIVLIIIVASAIEGAVRGFVYEICSLIGLIVGFLLAIRYFGDLVVYLDFIHIAPWLLNLIAFLLIMAVVSILFTLLGKALRAALSKIFLGWLDHTAGAIFGLVRGVISVLLIALLLQLTPLGKVIKLEASETRFMPLILETVHPIMDALMGDSERPKNVI